MDMTQTANASTYDNGQSLGHEAGSSAGIALAGGAAPLLAAARAYRSTKHHGRGGGEYYSGWCWGYERGLEGAGATVT